MLGWLDLYVRRMDAAICRDPTTGRQAQARQCSSEQCGGVSQGNGASRAVRRAAVDVRRMHRQANRGADKPHRQRPDDDDERNHGESTGDTRAKRVPSTETENQRRPEEARGRRIGVRRPGVRCIPTVVLVRDQILGGCSL